MRNVIVLIFIAGLLDEPYNLDMPYNARLASADEEEAPQLITYFEKVYVADAVCFVLDYSASMEGEKIRLLREQTKKAVLELLEKSELNIIIFHDVTIQWKERLVNATNDNKNSAILFSQTQELGKYTIVSPAVITALKQLRKSDKKRKQVILVCDGRTGEIPETSLKKIQQNNPDRIPIDTIFINRNTDVLQRMNDDEARIYMQAISAQSGGEFREVR